MKAELKEIYSLEIDADLQNFIPNDPTDFGFSVRLMIGTKGSNGAESFDIFVCTPDWIKRECKDYWMTWGRHMLRVLEYDFARIRSEVERYIDRCSGDDWNAIAEKISRIGAWEFEDYVSFADS